ncbi:hypothetical protein [Trichlorobacter lovleyi]|jgi:hypothetical protein|uniref:Uncharacterized protein n=1 Tax=Trichlorobacter lovleyi (strain ATCC BAA-1151 / DSM 17278 / SZ) TaxID=398767 RepID=B3E987_TRIL1|nr:hypothetical protein [Trichlorobacter lovleyi]ACD96800.1 hypothetical protein Glov_3094 [Trichlorobacter lovleyi SZ]
MSVYLTMLQQLKHTNKQFVAACNGTEKLVTITNITDDAVTLEGVDSSCRYDLHFTQVVIVGVKSS